MSGNVNEVTTTVHAYSSSRRVFPCIFIVLVTRTNMNRLFLISGIAVFVAAVFLITSTPNTTMAYVCNSSSSTHNVNLQSSLTGSSGGCAVSSSAATTSSPNGSTQATGSGPNNTVGVGLGSNAASLAETINRPGSATGFGTIDDPSGGVGTTSSASSGGSQASCSSSSATGFGSSNLFTGNGAVTSSSSQSQPGRCP